MIFDGKPTSQITVAEIEVLVTERVSEDQYLDFKKQPYPTGDAGAREMIKDVSAFANAAGGYLIIGIEEDGQGRGNGFVHVADAEAVRRSIIDRCFTLIEPRLLELDVHVFSVNGNDVVVCRVPDSPLKPHLAQPDREHHYFWRRYVDGNKLMTHAEIREAIQGDAVQREVAALRQDLVRQHTRETAVREMEIDVDEQGLRRLESAEAFAHHTKRLFLKQVGGRPYFRLTATPLPPNGHDIRDRREAVVPLLAEPLKYRHGWDVGAHGVGPPPRQTAAGLQVAATDFHHLRLYWNGHLEYWTPADDKSFTWGMEENLPTPQRSINPLAIIEATASFIRLANQVWTTTGITGDVEFRLSLHRVRGRRIPPYAHNTYGRLSGIPAMITDPTMGAFQDDEIHVGPVREQIVNVPGTVVFQLVSDVYYRLGYSREHIPYFDDQNRYMDDPRIDARLAGSDRLG